ncbi:hypothetical protein ME800_05700 [Lactobacillus delbrueckii]|nr:hypothetical protein ME782_09020 [Lactobacillus delbrueckii]GHN48961.1 hypothetical protein ME800_05700 [Lactobacillus delbrueckii]
MECYLFGIGCFGADGSPDGKPISCFGSESVSTTAHAIPQMEEHARSEFRTRETVRLLIFG